MVKNVFFNLFITVVLLFAVFINKSEKILRNLKFYISDKLVFSLKIYFIEKY